jgi:hypothetical protein
MGDVTDWSEVRFRSLADVARSIELVGFVPEADMALGPKGAHFEGGRSSTFSPTIVVRRFGHEHG